MNSVYLFLANCFEETEAITVVDVLRRAGIKISTVSVTGGRTVMGAHQVPIMSDALFEECDFSDAAMLVLPGGMPGAVTLSEHQGLCSLIKKFAKEGKRLSAICAAPMVLGKLGLLKGKNATCYPGFEHFLDGATVLPEQVVVDGLYITGSGPGASMEFALAIVDALMGRGQVDSLKKMMKIK
jgi:4-methyl-5(b-hydroxyethyl)-thiazole monophosphate biosynthesis